MGHVNVRHGRCLLKLPVVLKFTLFPPPPKPKVFYNKHKLVKTQTGKHVRAKAKEKVCVFSHWQESCN